jgi:hypothetical protein
MQVVLVGVFADVLSTRDSNNAACHVHLLFQVVLLINTSFKDTAVYLLVKDIGMFTEVRPHPIIVAGAPTAGSSPCFGSLAGWTFGPKVKPGDTFEN